MLSFTKYKYLEKNRKYRVFLLEDISKLLQENKQVAINVKGNSMLPFLRDSVDKVTIVKSAVYSVGDVVLAKLSNGRYVLHRIVSSHNSEVQLMGDGNVGITECCTCDNIQGKVILFHRKEKVYSEEGLIWKIYSGLWMRLSPYRKYLLKINRLFF